LVGRTLRLGDGCRTQESSGVNNINLIFFVIDGGKLIQARLAFEAKTTPKIRGVLNDEPFSMKATGLTLTGY
jgi:hypothetical protein